MSSQDPSFAFVFLLYIDHSYVSDSLPDKARLLMIRERNGSLNLPGGRVNNSDRSGKSIGFTAMRREFREETGTDLPKSTYVGSLDHHWGKSFSRIYFLAVHHGSYIPNLRYTSSEIQEVVPIGDTDNIPNRRGALCKIMSNPKFSRLVDFTYEHLY